MAELLIVVLLLIGTSDVGRSGFGTIAGRVNRVASETDPSSRPEREARSGGTFSRR
jgi:hypothetical protein